MYVLDIDTSNRVVSAASVSIFRYHRPQFLFLRYTISQFETLLPVTNKLVTNCFPSNPQARWQWQRTDDSPCPCGVMSRIDYCSLALAGMPQTTIALY